MSELKVDKVSPRSGTYVSLNTVGSKNIFINGDMSIAQRSTSVASVATGYNTCDRWNTVQTSLGAFTQSQSTDVPTGQGFATSLKMDCTTADASPAVADRLFIEQKFEGQNLQYLKKGTANAVSTTLSFWVKSIKTGTYITQLYDVDNDRSISKSYTVDVTDTWEKKTITFDGDTTGTLGNDNSNDLSARFYLGVGTNYSSGTLGTSWAANVNANVAVGQVNLADNTANEWYITGVQLEAGTTASDFEFLPYDVNLERCGRYYEKSYSYGTVAGTATNTGMRLGNHNTTATTGYLNNNTVFSYYKRATPTVTIYDNAGNSGKCTRSVFGGTETTDQSVSTDSGNEKSIHVFSSTGSNSNVIYYHFIANAEL
jgi:hypothetical protein